MRSNTFMMTSELRKSLIKRRGGYRLNASDSYDRGKRSNFVAVLR